MTKIISKNKEKPYDSATDHRDKGDYEITVHRSYSFEEAIDGKNKGGSWSADIVYKTKTLKIVRTNVGDGPMRLRLYRCYPENPVKDELQRQKTYERMVPYLEKFREYREATKKRYEVIREENRREKLPLIPHG